MDAHAGAAAPAVGGAVANGAPDAVHGSSSPSFSAEHDPLFEPRFPRNPSSSVAKAWLDTYRDAREDWGRGRRAARTPDRYEPTMALRKSTRKRHRARTPSPSPPPSPPSPPPSPPRTQLKKKKKKKSTRNVFLIMPVVPKKSVHRQRDSWGGAAGDVLEVDEDPSLGWIGDGLEVRESTLPGAGLGLFATRFYAAGSLITLFDGTIISYESAMDRVRAGTGTHIRTLMFKTLAIDGLKGADANLASRGGGSIANDGRWDPRLFRYGADTNNSTYEPRHTKMGDRIFLKALRDIQPGDEILVSYGRNYWMQHARELMENAVCEPDGSASEQREPVAADDESKPLPA